MIGTITRVCISDVREEGGLATLKELREKFGAEKVVPIFLRRKIMKRKRGEK